MNARGYCKIQFGKRIKKNISIFHVTKISSFQYFMSPKFHHLSISCDQNVIISVFHVTKISENFSFLLQFQCVLFFIIVLKIKTQIPYFNSYCLLDNENVKQLNVKQHTNSQKCNVFKRSKQLREIYTQLHSKAQGYSGSILIPCSNHAFLMQNKSDIFLQIRKWMKHVSQMH